MTVRLIVGGGYLGGRVARRWRDAGDIVHVVSRTPRGAAEWTSHGFVGHVADVSEPDTLKQLPAAETMLFAVGFDRLAGRSIFDVYVDGLTNVLDALTGRIGRVVYVSSTGVYGPAGGDWIDEDTPCEPQRDGGRACWEAEQRLVMHPLGTNSIRLRLAGIYGPDRIPFLARLAAGEPISTPPDTFLNLIHVEDAAHIVVLAAARAPAGRLYVVSDGCPVLRRDYYAEVARLLGGPPPRFAAADPTAPRTARAADGDKRVRPLRLMTELQPTLRYPDYRVGLAECLALPMQPE